MEAEGPRCADGGATVERRRNLICSGLSARSPRLARLAAKHELLFLELDEDVGLATRLVLDHGRLRGGTTRR